MAMLCLEEPRCPSSPLFKPCRFLLQADPFPFLPAQIDAHPRFPFRLAPSEEASGDEVAKRSKRSILAFLKHKARRIGDEKNQLK